MMEEIRLQKQTHETLSADGLAGGVSPDDLPPLTMDAFFDHTMDAIRHNYGLWRDQVRIAHELACIYALKSYPQEKTFRKFWSDITSRAQLDVIPIPLDILEDAVAAIDAEKGHIKKVLGDELKVRKAKYSFEMSVSSPHDHLVRAIIHLKEGQLDEAMTVLDAGHRMIFGDN